MVFGVLCCVRLFSCRLTAWRRSRLWRCYVVWRYFFSCNSGVAHGKNGILELMGLYFSRFCVNLKKT